MVRTSSRLASRRYSWVPAWVNVNGCCAVLAPCEYSVPGCDRSGDCRLAIAVESEKLKSLLK